MPEYRHNVSGFRLRDIGNVQHQLIHADLAENIGRFTVQQHFSPSRERTVVPVGITDRDGGNPHGAIRNKVSAVAYRASGRNLLDHGYDGFQLHQRFDRQYILKVAAGR